MIILYKSTRDNTTRDSLFHEKHSWLSIQQSRFTCPNKGGYELLSKTKITSLLLMQKEKEIIT